MMAFRALRSLASDFFMIVPLSSPALKLPAKEKEREISSLMPLNKLSGKGSY